IVGNSDNLLGLGVGDTVLSVNDTPVNDYFEMLNELTEASDGTLLIGSDLGRSEIQYSLPPDSIPFHPLVPAVIGESIVGLPAYESGIRAGDSITAIDGRSVAIWYDYQEIVSSTTDELAITFCRNGIKDTVYVTPHEYDGLIISGVTVQLPSERVKLPPGEAFVEGLKAAGRGAVGFCATLIKLIKKPAELAESSGGPIYVAETLGQQARSGLPSYLWTIANISLAIMIFNLLPIPILDGGQIVILLCEGIRGKPISKKHVQIIQQTGMILILMIFILIMFKDISRLVTRVR
ncbi:MAG: RIP metalloprotease RseP, partial [Candidatus Aegiribacteria sp.]|nr:RIP metalloprotease RseP [Candidatus Aegiribacteria sp.]